VTPPSAIAVCRLVECNVGIGVVPAATAESLAKTIPIHPIELIDEWAVRELTIYGPAPSL
jgi:hypothetical protein